MKNKTEYIIALTQAINQKNRVIDNKIIAQKSFQKEMKEHARLLQTLQRRNGGFTIRALNI